jgi:hypothetical protein
VGAGGRHHPLDAEAFRIPKLNFYEKALFVKPTWRPYIVAGAVAGALCAMLLSALLAGQLSLVTRCIG